MAKTQSDQLIFGKYFKFEVKGIYNEVPGCVSVSGCELYVDIEDAPPSDRHDYREYNYGSHQYGDLNFTVKVGPDMDKLRKWSDKAKAGDGINDDLRFDCSLYLLARDKSTVLRTISYFGCYPINYEADERLAAAGIKAITFTCSVERVEETIG
jgi:hypothetical protein